MSLVPTQLRRLLAAGADLAGFGTILLGGAAAPAGLLAAARAAGRPGGHHLRDDRDLRRLRLRRRPLDGVSVRTGAGGRIESPARSCSPGTGSGPT